MLDSVVAFAGLREDQWQSLLETARLADVGRLAGALAHQLGTPLASIALRAQSLSQHAADPRLVALEPFARFPRYLKTIEEETFRCKAVLSNLREFARPTNGDAKPVEMGELVRRVAALVEHEALRRQVGLDVVLGEGVPSPWGDAARLGQAVLSLVRNALEASGPGTRVTLEVRASGGGVEVEVSDHGHGIPAELADRVYEPFFTTRGPGYAGLGLSLCREITRAAGGELRFTSGPGQGTRFVLALPGSRSGPEREGHGAD
jgi:signal transduction histidine kinase